MGPSRAKKVTLTLKRPPNEKKATTKRTRRTTLSANVADRDPVLDPQLQDETPSNPPQEVNEEPAGTSAQPAIARVDPDGRTQNGNATELEEVAAIRGNWHGNTPSLMTLR